MQYTNDHGNVPTYSTAGLDTSTSTPAIKARAATVAHQVARGLGWFSIGLGLAELLAPRGLSRWIGVRDTPRSRATMLACGVRELGVGVALLTRPRRAAWLWARVAGDVLDLALLGTAATAKRRVGETHFPTAIAAVVGVTALDVVTATWLSTNAHAAVDTDPGAFAGENI